MLWVILQKFCFSHPLCVHSPHFGECCQCHVLFLSPISAVLSLSWILVYKNHCRQRKIIQMHRLLQNPGYCVPLASLMLCPPACCPHDLLPTPSVAYSSSSQPEAMLLNVAGTYVVLGSCLNCPPLLRMHSLDTVM